MTSEPSDKPLLAITMGDPAGIGPETIAGAWQEPAFHRRARALAVGHPEVFRRGAALLNAPLEVVPISDPRQTLSSTRQMPCLPSGDDQAKNVPPAKNDPRGGQAAYEATVLATQLALEKQVDAIVTAPLSKAALQAAGHRYPGHTELLADLCGCEQVAMMLYLARGGRIQGRAGLGVVHVTLHTALRDVFSMLTIDVVVSKTHLAHQVMERLLQCRDALQLNSENEVAEGVDPDSPPRIGVAALNPHAGEEGLFGDEEQHILLPAVERCRGRGLSVTGPLACDTLMVRAAAGEFDAVVAMYHDQGHIALKLLGMRRAVNITLGLPIIRTSVAHGTAFDIAWQGRADCGSMIEAARIAAELA